MLVTIGHMLQSFDLLSFICFPPFVGRLLTLVNTSESSRHQSCVFDKSINWFHQTALIGFSTSLGACRLRLLLLQSLARPLVCFSSLHFLPPGVEIIEFGPVERRTSFGGENYS